ncbi:MAG: hypothetical protein KA715_02530 [Xanthomonadaceae bacterium]|nr:hypothetical protein [Xanthomonadaceae bacterium]
MNIQLLGIVLAISINSTHAMVAEGGGVNPDKIHAVDLKKSQSYIRDGLFVGGDAQTTDVNLKDIRFAKNKEYERLVMDFTGSAGRSPYFQVDVSPEMSRLVVTVYGKVKLGFEPKLVAKAFAKSAFVERIELLPQIETDRWTYSLTLKDSKRPQVEVFELGAPTRAIIDLKP